MEQQQIKIKMTLASATLVPDIPAYLIYEQDEGRSIYYKGYLEVLAGAKTRDDIMGDSTLQAWIKSKLYLLLCGALLENGYEVLVGEIGLQLAPKTTRAADIAIFKSDKLILSNKYTDIAPEVVIEIDVKVDYANGGKLIEYYERKTQKLLEFGVKKVIWIFTDSESLIIAEEGQKQFLNWADDVQVLGDVAFNLQQLLLNKRP